MPIGRHGEESYCADEEKHCRTYPEVPSPRKVLSADSANEDAREKSYRGTCAVEAEYQVLPRSWTINTSKQHHACRQEGRWAKTLQGTAKVHHKLILAKAANEGPDEVPDQAGHKESIATVDVCESTKRKKERASHQ